MARESISMLKLRQILRLNNEQRSVRQISEMLGLHRKTVSKYIVLYEASGMSYKEIEGYSDEQLHELLCAKEKTDTGRYEHLETLLPDLEKELRRVGVTKFRLWEEYKRSNPGGYNYTQFCHYFSQWLKKDEAVMHFEHKAGDKMFVDYTGKKLYITDRKSGELHEVEVFVAVLGGSQMTYVKASLSQKKEDFISSVENALHYYGGVPRAILPDNLKSAVTKSSRYEAQIKEEFERFALHYGTTILPARSYKPRDKALVEGAVKIVYNRIFAELRNRVFYTIDELNDAISELLEVYNGIKLQNRDYSRSDIFKETERKELQALPAERYEIKEYSRLTVNKNCHIWLKSDEHYYSAPYRVSG